MKRVLDASTAFEPNLPHVVGYPSRMGKALYIGRGAFGITCMESPFCSSAYVLVLAYRAFWEKFFQSTDVFLLPSTLTAAFAHDPTPIGTRTTVPNRRRSCPSCTIG